MGGCASECIKWSIGVDAYETKKTSCALNATKAHEHTKSQEQI